MDKMADPGNEKATGKPEIQWIKWLILAMRRRPGNQKKAQLSSSEGESRERLIPCSYLFTLL
jgi:hypothetical protein